MSSKRNYGRKKDQKNKRLYYDGYKEKLLMRPFTHTTQLSNKQ